MNEAVLTQDIQARCKSQGFFATGICDATTSSYESELRQWLDDDKHGEMSYLKENLDALLDPSRVLEGVQSIICVADRYHSGHRDPVPPAKHGNIARYARGDDYHKRMKKRLHAICDALQQQFPDEQFRACVDTAPILEREYAQRAGLGAVGKNSLLLIRGIGSYFFLGEILSTRRFEPTATVPADPCATCTRCIDACPTDAITPWSVDASRCISYLTIEHRSEIDEALTPSLDGWLFGCDRCQEVCPHNRPTARSKRIPTNEHYQPRQRTVALEAILNWTDEERRDFCSVSAMKRARLNMMKRNALLLVANDEEAMADNNLIERVRQLASDEREDPIVSKAANAILMKRCGDDEPEHM